MSLCLKVSLDTYIIITSLHASVNMYNEIESDATRHSVFTFSS